MGLPVWARGRPHPCPYLGDGPCWVLHSAGGRGRTLHPLSRFSVAVVDPPFLPWAAGLLWDTQHFPTSHCPLVPCASREWTVTELGVQPQAVKSLPTPKSPGCASPRCSAAALLCTSGPKSGPAV